MAIRRVTPQQAAELTGGDGWTYVDVRTIPEFEAEHPRGAHNVPLLHQGPAGRASNPDFVAVMAVAFGRKAKLVIGCASGARSRRAVEMLAEAGFENLADMGGGFAGEVDSMGRLVSPGWKACGLPCASKAEAGHSYAELAKKAAGGAS